MEEQQLIVETETNEIECVVCGSPDTEEHLTFALNDKRHNDYFLSLQKYK